MNFALGAFRTRFTAPSVSETSPAAFTLAAKIRSPTFGSALLMASGQLPEPSTASLQTPSSSSAVPMRAAIERGAMATTS
jgi:hypothetical protein